MVSAVAPGAGTPTGTVTFEDGAASIGTGVVTSGIATFSTSSLTLGTHSLTAIYSGDANFLGSTAATHTIIIAELYNHSEPVSGSLGDPQDTGNGLVYLNDGEFHDNVVDLTIPGRGLDWSFQRDYRSGEVTDGPLGRNWDFNYDRRLLVVTADNLAGVQLSFASAAAGDVVRIDGLNRADLYVLNGDGTYTAPPGFFTRLTLNGDGSYSERDASGLVISYAAPGSNSVAAMSAMTDANGDTMQFHHNSLGQLDYVVDTLGRTITYNYDSGNGHLLSVVDFSGRTLSFAYAGEDLLSVTSPAVTGTPTGNDFLTGKTEVYTYSSSFPDYRLNHELLTITAPNEVASSGPARVTVTYDTTSSSPDAGRVTRLALGGTNQTSVPAGGSITYAYQSLPTASSGDFATAVFQTTVTDRNTNVTQYQFNQRGNIVQTREFTDGSRIPRSGQPDFFETDYTYNGDYELTQATMPLTNSITNVYSSNPDRLEQGNLLSTTQTPDAVRGGDQTQLQTTYTYEPLFNHVRSVTDPRGNDSSYLPPNGGSWSQARYTTVYTYDYQEGADYTGLAAKLGLTASQVQAWLIAAGIPMGLGDVNGDGITNQINGNVIRMVQPTVRLLAGSNEAAIEGAIYQPIVTECVYNAYGLLTKTIDPEGNANEYQYYALASPGSGSFSSAGGGYLAETIQDSSAGLIGRDSGTNPAATNITNVRTYDSVGNVTSETDGRGITTQYIVNQLNQVVETIRAAAVPGFSTAEPLTLTAYTYLERTFYDYNNNVVLSQVEDRGNTSNVDGNLPSGDLPNVPGAANADPVGGTAFVDTAYHYDILDQQTQMVQEVQNGSDPKFLYTSYRYDANGNSVFTIMPEGNASSSVYDERNLLFQSTSGTSTRPTAGLYASGDPTTFNRPGGSGTTSSTVTYNYDQNGNQIETVSAVSHGGITSSIAGAGDVSATAYDGFDRPKVTTNALGDQTINTYDPAGNTVRVVQKGAALDDVLSADHTQTLAVTEYVPDELSRTFVTHQVIFLIPGNLPSRTPVLTSNSAMDSLAAYLADASSDTASVPGISDITVLGRISSITEYDRDSRVAFTVDDALHTRGTQYDGAGRVIKTTDSALSNGFSSGAFHPAYLAGNTVETAYDGDSEPIEIKSTEVTLIAGVADEVFRTTDFYDSLDRLETSVDSRDQATNERYDSRNNEVATANAKGPANGRQLPRRGLGDTSLQYVNGFGNVSLTSVDGMDRTVETDVLLTASGAGDGSFIGVDGNGVKQAIPPGYLDITVGIHTGQGGGDGIDATYQAWDNNSELLAVRDDNGATTEYERDNQDRLLVERDGVEITTSGFYETDDGEPGSFDEALPTGGYVTPDTTTQTTLTDSYDGDSLITSDTDLAGNVFTNTFDALGRKKTVIVTVNPATAFADSTQQTWTFDGLSRQTSATNGNPLVLPSIAVTTIDMYDSLSRNIEEHQQIGSVPAAIVSYNFDVGASGSVDQPSALIYPDGRQLDSTYDNLDRLISHTDDGQSSAIGTYQYIGPIAHGHIDLPEQYALDVY